VYHFSSVWWWLVDADVAMKTRTEPIQWQGDQRDRVTERKVAREDPEGGVHKRSSQLQEWHREGDPWKGSHGEDEVVRESQR
jgi:hypothetical protein